MKIPLLIGLIFFIDQITKLAVSRTFEVGESLRILPFFHLTLVWNTGTAFGLFQDSNFLFIVIALLIISMLIMFRKSMCAGDPFAGAGFILILGGALGNLTDRILHGYVIDFLDFIVWPVFNIADSAICIGTGLLVVATFRIKEKEQEHNASDTI